MLLVLGIIFSFSILSLHKELLSESVIKDNRLSYLEVSPFEAYVANGKMKYW